MKNSTDIQELIVIIKDLHRKDRPPPNHPLPPLPNRRCQPPTANRSPPDAYRCARPGPPSPFAAAVGRRRTSRTQVPAPSRLQLLGRLQSPAIIAFSCPSLEAAKGALADIAIAPVTPPLPY